MRWYLLMSMIIVFSTSTMQSMSNFVPSLEYEPTAEDIDDLFLRISPPTMPKIPAWQMMLQQWGSSFMAQVLRFKEYTNDQCQKLKMIIHAMIFHNAVARRQ